MIIFLAPAILPINEVHRLYSPSIPHPIDPKEAFLPFTKKSVVASLYSPISPSPTSTPSLYNPHSNPFLTSPTHSSYLSSPASPPFLPSSPNVFPSPSNFTSTPTPTSMLVTTPNIFDSSKKESRYNNTILFNFIIY